MKKELQWYKRVAVTTLVLVVVSLGFVVSEIAIAVSQPNSRVEFVPIGQWEFSTCNIDGAAINGIREVEIVRKYGFIEITTTYS